MTVARVSRPGPSAGGQARHLRREPDERWAGEKAQVPGGRHGGERDGGGVPWTRAAALKRSGIVLAIPSPTAPKPMTARTGEPDARPTARPAAAIVPETRSTRRGPKRSTARSPAKRPPAIAAANAANPPAAYAGSAPSASCRY